MNVFSTITAFFVALFRFFFPKEKSVKGENVLITGAGSGLGRLLAVQFAAQGANLVLWDVQQEENQKTAAQCRGFGVQVLAQRVDVGSNASVYAAAELAKKEIGFISIVVNNAGIVSGRKFMDCSDEQIQRTMNVNTLAHFWIAKAFLPEMIARNHGHVVSIASSAGLVGVSGLADYCASKFGAVGFMEAIRMELGKTNKTGVKTTIVCPYFINTGMFDGVKTRFNFLLPILEPDYVVSKIMRAIRTDSKLLALPRFIYLVPLLKLLGPSAQDVLAAFLGVSSSMDAFKGRGECPKSK